MPLLDRTGWKYVRGLTPPILVLAILLGWLGYLLYARAQWWQESDENNLREWLNESPIFRATLPELVRDYLDDPDNDFKAEEVYEQVNALCVIPRVFGEQLPLFPKIYRVEIVFADPAHPNLPPIRWGDDAAPSSRGQVLEYNLISVDDPRARIRLEYQLHAYNQRQREQEHRQSLLQGVSVMAAVALVMVIVWIYFFLKRQRARELQWLFAQQQIERSEKLRLESELARQEVEQKHQATERTLLEQELATQAAEQQALELKSQLYASISIMAGSYAHNIKNLLVRPNDLLSRCLEADGLSTNQQHMLDEVRQTLGTVTERLQQILKTVRRDPTRSEMSKVDLNVVVGDMLRTWEDLARDKWKLSLKGDLCPGPLWIEGDISHLQQAVENLLFNARDATFEMRNHLREQARQSNHADGPTMRVALIEAAAWKGSTILRTRKVENRAILEVQDNGIGMTEEVRARCVETHFSTKRDNAIYEGISTGMGLGLSFVVVILEHHGAKLEIESKPGHGALFRAAFPAV